ncbi:hypothetical protein K1T71_007078 [Dendrolimus kikuchii]|uniref:Uncharacterized protein n=1 Tax=Dendrolimus kikuchii TaxID=765133 RepID=A0ACC1D025_9NEOP|nr:hypothetical protein K1T71_007078 [Dendrolimus kikuchii]
MSDNDTSTGSNSTTTQNFPTFYTPIYVMTAIFGAIFIIGPFFVKKNNENCGIIRTCIMLTAFCMWIFWVTLYIAQMNPLSGPRVRNTSLLWIGYKWELNPRHLNAIETRMCLLLTML